MPDPKALEAAELELSEVLKDCHYVMPTNGMDRVIRAYLSASLPADTAELVERLEEEGFLRAREKQELHGGDERWLNDRIQKDLCSRAASLIQSQATALAAKDAELAARRKAAEHLLERAQTAEAQLAEANKALDRIIERADTGGRRLETAMRACDEIEGIARSAREELGGGNV